MANLEDLIALNDEVTLLAQAGVPLDNQLLTIGKNRRHQLTQINAAVARRIGRGESLVDAVAAEDDSLPSLYQDIVEAGLRCGRLPAVLEGLSDYSQTSLQLKRGLTTALVYPLVIVTLAYALFVSSLIYYVPTLVASHRELDVPLSIGLKICQSLRETLDVWGWIPGIVLVVLVWSWMQSSRSATIGWTGLLTPLNHAPWIRVALRDARHSGIARLSAFLVGNDVPLDISLRLATGVVGDRRMRLSAANRAKSGEDRAAFLSLAPLLRWAILQTNASIDEQADSLQLAADLYHSRATSRLHAIRRRIPVVAIVVVGGVAVLMYVLSVFGPFLYLVRGLL